MSVGLVLGAGGPLGWAFHLGVLEGLRDALGVEPADATRIVGTSAGGAIAASLLAGADSETVLASISAPMSEEDRVRMRESLHSVRRRRLRALRPLAPGLAATAWRRPPLVSAVGLLPGGVFPTAPMRRFPVHDVSGWPSSLWMPSVRMDRGSVVVFGRDRLDVPVADAVEATSAVPGMFRPKRIDGVDHVDGAVASATHADLLAEDRHDVVVISSVMSRPGRRPMRIRARRQLAAERCRLEASGTRTVLVEPDAEIVRLAAGFPRTGPDAGPVLVAAARRHTAGVIAAGLAA